MAVTSRPILSMAGRIGNVTCKSVLKCHIHCLSGHFTVTGLRKHSVWNVLSEKQSLFVNPVAGLNVHKRFQFTHSTRLRNRRLDLPKRSQEFISNLRSLERETLLAELLKYQNVKKVETSTETNLDTDLPEAAGVPNPTRQQLRLVAFSNALPFIGFGFFDNAIMIIAGDYIDVTIGGALSISTMAAAAFGNMISDVAGIGLAGTVEAFVSKIGVQIPVLTPEQQDLTKIRWTASMARAVGIAIGCFIGMFPLLFLKTKEDIESEDEEKGTT
ncbi:transmembrane protein 65 [Strongylocentrotus purpuratus]|uniref:Transmembrane protein 65 n=1 Tax=Strongylocentrotus purpuratus TaxID=7668 RepID=A0A7M7RGY4_STRPU|nr:transmembrane protein 65 [Strongylocentrotus purpuratus]